MSEKKLDGQVTILFSNDGLKIEVVDKESSTLVLSLSLNKEQTCKALSRLGQTDCSMVFCQNPDRVGKRMENKRFEFELEGYDPFDFSCRKDAARRLAVEKCPEGWEPDLYFGSQSSFFSRDGVAYASCVIRRWVEIEEGETDAG